MNTAVAFSLLASSDRQDVLRELTTTDGPCTVDELTAVIADGGEDRATLERAEVELVHRHLPKLAAHDVVEWHDDAIERTAATVQLVELLEATDELLEVTDNR